MKHRLKKRWNEACLEMEDLSGQTVYFDKAGFLLQLRDSLRLELQKELKKVIMQERTIRHENLIKYTALEKYEGDLYLVRDDNHAEIFPMAISGLEEACRILLKILEIVGIYHEQGILLKGLSMGQLKQDSNGDFRLQDPLVMNFLSHSLEHIYRIDLPPEVIRGQDWSESSDIFSWGELAYQLLGGEDPFKANSPEERVEKIIKTNVIHLRDLQPKISQRLSQIIMDCLSPVPQKRPTVPGLIEQLTVMISEGNYQVSDQTAEAYTEKARNNRKKYQRVMDFQLWFKKYRVPIYISLAIVLFIGIVLGTRQKSVLKVNTSPRTVVDYYYRGIKTLDPMLVNETLYKVNKKVSFDDMVVNLYVLSKGRQYMNRTNQDTVIVSFPEFKMMQLTRNKNSTSYRTDYTLKIYTTNQINCIQRTEELTLNPIRKIWRITNIRVIREKRWTEQAEASPLPETPPGNVK
jgi:serine/threonine protein kinase